MSKRKEKNVGLQEDNKKEALNEAKRRRLTRKGALNKRQEIVALKQRNRKERKRAEIENKTKRAETKKQEGAALKLKKREGWNREFFSIYFLSNLLRKNYGELVCVGFNF